jgi:hypothetical protein
MNRLAYPASVLVADYLRAAAGLVPIFAILLMVPVGIGTAAVLGALAALFLVFGVRTALRHATRIELGAAAVRAAGPFAASIAWSELDSLKLAYYSTRRDKSGGWLQLELRAGRSALRLDSRIDGFALLVERAARAAAARGLELDRATATNLRALGLSAPAARPSPAEACGSIA